MADSDGRRRRQVGKARRVPVQRRRGLLCVFDYGLSTDNVIYYSHTNTLSFNWNGYGEKITQEEFDDFVNKVDRSQLPEGIKFELK